MPEKFSKILYDIFESKNIKIGYNYAEFDSLLKTDKVLQNVVYERIGKEASGWTFEEFELAIEDKDYKENKVTKGNAESAIWRVLGNLFKSSFIGSAPVIPMHSTQYSKEITDDIEIIKEKSKEDVLQLWEDPIGGGASIGKGILRGGGKLALSMGNYALTAKDLSNLYSTENRLSSSIRGNSVLDNVFLEMGLRQNELDEFVDKTIPVQKGFENSFLFGKVPEGIGQAGVTILPGVAMFRAGFSPFYISSAIGIGTQTPIMVGEAVKGGAKTEDLKEVAAWAIPIGMIEAIGGKKQADFLLKPFLREGNWYGFAKELGKAWVRSGKTESIYEEFPQTVGENLVAMQYYDFQRGFLEGTLEATAAAFISSGTMGVGTKLVSGMGKDYKVSEMNDETKKKLNVINLAPSAELQIQKDGNYKIVDLKTEATPEFKEAKELAEKMLPEIKKNEAADEVIRDRKISEEASKSGQVEKVSPRGSNEVIEGNVEAVDIEKNLGVIENLIKGEKGTVLKTSRDSKTASLVQGTTIVIDKVELTAEEQAELKHKLELRQQKEITRKELDSWKSNFGKQVGIRLQEEINKKQASIEKKKIADAVNVEISEIEIHNFAHRLVGFKNDLANKLVKRENFIKDITDKFVGYNTIDEALAGFKIEKEIANQIKKNVELHPEFKKIQVKAEGKTVAEKIANTHIEFKSTAPQAYTMQIAAYIDSINEMETESLVDSYEDSVLFQEHKKHTELSKAAFRQHNKDVRFYGRFSKETAEELYKELVRKYGNSYVNRPYKVRDNFYAVKLKGYKQFEREQEQSFSKVRREENEVDSPQSGIAPLFQTSDNKTEAIEESKNIESDEGIQSKKQIAIINKIKSELPIEIANAVTVENHVPQEILGRDDLYLSMKDIFEEKGITDPFLINWFGINLSSNVSRKSVIKNIKSEAQIEQQVKQSYKDLLKATNPIFKNKNIKQSFDNWVKALENYPVVFRDLMLKHAIKNLKFDRRNKFILQLSAVALQQTYGMAVNKPHELHNIGKLYDSEVLKTVSDAVGHEPSASGRGYWVHIPRVSKPIQEQSYEIRPTVDGFEIDVYIIEQGAVRGQKGIEEFKTRLEAENYIKEEEKNNINATSSQFKVNVELLKKLSPATWCTADGSAPTYIQNYDNYILIVDGITVVGIEAHPKGFMPNEEEVTEKIQDLENEIKWENNAHSPDYLKIEKLNKEIKRLKDWRPSKIQVNNVTSRANNGIASIDHLDDTLAFFEKHNLDTNIQSLKNAIQARNNNKTDEDISPDVDLVRAEDIFNLIFNLDDNERIQAYDFYDAYREKIEILSNEARTINTIPDAIEFINRLDNERDKELYHALEDLKPEILANEQVATLIVEKDGRNIIFIDQRLPFYKELAYKAVQSDAANFTYISGEAQLEERNKELWDNYLPFSKTNTNQIQGYYDAKNDKVVVIAANTPVDEASRVAIHEVAHRGMVRMAKDLGEINTLYEVLLSAKPQLMEKLPELLKRTGHTSLENLMKDYGFTTDTKEGELKLLSELAARWAETLVNKPRPSWWKNLLKNIGQWLNKFTNVTLNEQQVNELVGGFVKYGTDNTATLFQESNEFENQILWESSSKSSGLQGYGTKRTIAIIGTAGRKQVPTLQEWNNMVENAASTVTTKDTLISGGAAFADHIAVRLFLDGKVEGLILRLPAKIVNHKFVGKPAGSTANYYHNNFSKLLGVDTILEIEQAIAKGAKVSYETDTSYKAMFDRNTKIAKESDAMLAYTFGKDNTPSDGGTKDTWDKAKYTNKLHVSIPIQEKQTGRQAIREVYEKTDKVYKRANVSDATLSLEDVLKEYTIEELKQGVSLKSLQTKIEEKDFETIKKAYNYLKSEEAYRAIKTSNEQIESKLEKLKYDLRQTKETKVGSVLTITNDENDSNYKAKVIEINKYNNYAILKLKTFKNKEYTIKVNSDGTTKSGYIEDFVFESINTENAENIKSEINNLKSQLQKLKSDYSDYYVDYFKYDNEITPEQTERQDIQGSKGFIPNPSQSMASPPNVSPAASNSKIGQVKKTNVKAVAKRLAELRIEDSFIKEYSEWLFEATKDVQVEIVNSDYVIASNTDSKGNISEVTLEDRPGAFIPSENKIVINQTKIDNEGSNWLYGTLTHEATHSLTADAVDDINGGHKFDRKFREGVEEVYDTFMADVKANHREFYETHKDLFDIIDYDKSLKGIALRKAKTLALKEFLGYGMSNTSVNLPITQFMQNTNMNANTSYLMGLWNRIKLFFTKLLGGKDPTYWNGLEVLFSEKFGYKREAKNIIEEQSLGNKTTTGEDTFDWVSALQSDNLDAVNIKNIVKLLDKDTKDWYAYIKNLTYPQFLSELKSSSDVVKSIAVYHKKNNLTETPQKYINKVALKLYLLAHSLEYNPVVRLNIFARNGFYGKEMSSFKIEELPMTYYDKNNNEKASYQVAIKLKEYIPMLNKLFGVEFELIYLDSVKEFNFDTKITTWKSINSFDFNLTERNEYYGKLLAEKGIYFPGTWADKNTVVAFRLKEGKLDVTKMEALYEKAITDLVTALNEINPQTGKPYLSKKEIKLFLTKDKHYQELKNSYILRAVLDDFRLGGRVDEKGNLHSALLNPDLKNSYDALKILKRVTDILPLHKVLNDKETNERVYNNLTDKTGIILNEDGSLSYNTAIISLSSDQVLELEFKGKKISVPLNQLLVNEMGTDNFDGANIHTGSYGEVINEIAGVTKPGAKKGKVINHIDKSPFYNKGAWFYSESPILKKWMEEHNIAVLMFDGAVKYNSHSQSNLLGSPEVITMPFTEYYHDMEKDVAIKDAKGLTQSLIASYATDSNKSYVPKDPNILSNVLEVLLNDFNEKMLKLDAVKILEDAQSSYLEGTSKVQDTINTILVDYIYEYTGRTFKQTIKNEQIANIIGNLFFEPIFTSLLKSYVRKNLSKVLNYRVYSSWQTLRPDFGWLEPNVIEQVWNNIETEVKVEFAKVKNLEQEILGLKNAFDLIPENSIGEGRYLLDEIKKLETEMMGLLDNLEEDIEDTVWKHLNERIDTVTGKLKDGWAYLATDINKVKDEKGNFVYEIKPGDNVIFTVIPGTDIASQSAPRIAALLTGVDPGTLTMHSEFIQTRNGRDFDIDQMLATPFTSKFFTREGYQDFVKSANESASKFEENVLVYYRHVLKDKNLTIQQLYDKEVQVKFMQAISESVKEGQTLFNPIWQSFSLLNNFTKEVGVIVNDNKVFTMQASVGFTTKINIFGTEYILDARKGITRYAIIASRLLHDAVDKPTNTNGFFYKLDLLHKYDIVYGMGLIDNLKKQGILVNTGQGLKIPDIENRKVIDKAIQAIQKMNRSLFVYGTKITSGYNIDNFEGERGLPEDVTYIQNQQMINHWLKEKKTNLLADKFEDNKNPFKAELILNAEIEDINKSAMLDAIENINLSNIPNLYITLLEYTIWQKRIYERLAEDPEYKEILELTRKNNKKYFADFAKEKSIRYKDDAVVNYDVEANEYLLNQFLATRYNGKNTDLHILKAKLIAIMNPIPQHLGLLTEQMTETYYANIYDVANDFAYPKLMKLLLDRRAVEFNLKSDSATLVTPGGKRITLKPSKDGHLEVTTTINKVEHTFTAKELLEGKTQVAKQIYDVLTSDKGLFNSARFEITTKRKEDFTNREEFDKYYSRMKEMKFAKNQAATNRQNFSQLVNFANNTDFNERIKISKELVDSELPNFERLEKKIFWNSLVGYPTGALTVPLNLIPRTGDRFTEDKFPTQELLLELASKTNDKSGKEFLQRYIAVAPSVYPGLGFNRTMRINEALEDDVLTSQTEVLFQLSQSEAQKLNSEDLKFFDNFKEIYGIIKAAGDEKLIDPTTKIASTIDLFNGKMININSLMVTNTALSATLTRATAPINLEAIAATVQMGMLAHFKPYIARFDKLAFLNMTFLDVLVKNTGKSNVEIISEVNKLSEKLPYTVDLKFSSTGSYIYVHNEVVYSTVDNFLTAVGITDINERTKHKMALNLRIIYDVLNTRLSNAVAGYLQVLFSNLPEGFANSAIIKAHVDKWTALLEQFKGRKGMYIPHVYTKETAEELNSLMSAYNIIVREYKKEGKQGTREDILNEAKARLEKAEPTFIEAVEKGKEILDKHTGFVHSWEMKRKFPEWLIKDKYITDNFNIHEKHKIQFIAAAISDITLIHSLLYEHEASMIGRTERTKNRMKQWYALQAMHPYLKASKVGFDKISPKDKISFYYKRANGKEQHIDGVLESQTSTQIKLLTDKETLRLKYKTQLDKATIAYEIIITIPNFAFMSLTTKQAEKLDELNIPYKEDISILDASELIYDSLKTLLTDEKSWGVYNKENVYIKQYSKGKVITPQGVEKGYRVSELSYLTKTSELLKSKLGVNVELPKTTDEFWQALQRFNSLMALGTPGSAVRNFIESMWRTLQAVGFKKSHPAVFQAFKFKQEFNNLIKYSNFDEYTKTLKEVYKSGDIAKYDPAGKDPETVSKVQVLEALVAEYLLEHGLGNVNDTGASYVSDLNEDLGKDSLVSFDNATAEQIRKAVMVPIKGVASVVFSLEMFRKVERGNRIVGAYLFAYKAIFIDKITNVEEIRTAIVKGVGRVNSLYEMSHRLLLERTSGGRILSTFVQFSSYQLAMARKQLAQGRNLGQILPVWKPMKEMDIEAAYRNGKFNLLSLFSEEMTGVDVSGVERTYKRNDTVDPIILHTMGKEFLIDFVWGTLLQFMAPGLRVGNPVNKVLALFLIAITVFLTSGEEPDEWDIREFIFTLVGFRLGMGITFPIQMLYNLIFTDRRIVPAAKVETLTVEVAKGTFKDRPSGEKGDREALADARYFEGLLSRYLTSIDFTAHRRGYYSPFKNEVMTTPFVRRPDFMLRKGLKELNEIIGF